MRHRNGITMDNRLENLIMCPVDSKNIPFSDSKSIEDSLYWSAIVGMPHEVNYFTVWFCLLLFLLDFALAIIHCRVMNTSSNAMNTSYILLMHMILIFWIIFLFSYFFPFIFAQISYFFLFFSSNSIFVFLKRFCNRSVSFSIRSA